MTAEQRATFERDGYLIIRGALYPDEVAGAHDYPMTDLGSLHGAALLQRGTEDLGAVARNSQDLWIGVSRDLLITTL